MSTLISIKIPEPVLQSVRAHIEAINSELHTYQPNISSNMRDGLLKISHGRFELKGSMIGIGRNYKYQKLGKLNKA